MRVVRDLEALVLAVVAIAVASVASEAAIAAEVRIADQEQILLSDLQTLQSIGVDIPSFAAVENYNNYNNVGHDRLRSAARDWVTMNSTPPGASQIHLVGQVLHVTGGSTDAAAAPLTLGGNDKRVQPGARAQKRIADGATNAHSLTDMVLAALMGVGLITYQLCRKHRLLRPHPFSF